MSAAATDFDVWAASGLRSIHAEISSAVVEQHELPGESFWLGGAAIATTGFVQ